MRMGRIHADAANLGVKPRLRPPEKTCRGPGLQITPRGDGGAGLEVTLVATEAEELTAALRALIGNQAVDESPAGDDPRWAVYGLD